MAEELTDYLKALDIKVAYLHTEVKTLERLQIIHDLRSGKYDCVVGINLLREGIDIISLTSLTICCIILGKYDVTIISMSLLGALIAFLYFNKYPAKVFPGDTGTLIIGATIATIAFIGRVKLIAFIVLFPNIIDAALKFYSAGVMERQQFSPTRINDEGKLIRNNEGVKSLIRIVLRKPIEEDKAVKKRNYFNCINNNNNSNDNTSSGNNKYSNKWGAI